MKRHQQMFLAFFALLPARTQKSAVVIVAHQRADKSAHAHLMLVGWYR